MKVVSGYAFLRTYYVQKKNQQPIMLQQYVISIDARLRLRNSTFSVKAETAECMVARDSIIAWCLKECTFWKIQIYFTDSGRFFCVNAYSGHQYILFYFLFQIMVNKTEKRVEFSLRTIKIFSVWNKRWCYMCLLHKTRLQISSEGTSRVCGRSLTLASMCFLCPIWYILF